MFQSALPPAIVSHLDLIINFSTDLSRNLLESGQRLSALHMQLGRELLSEMASGKQLLMASRDASQLGSATGAQWNQGSAAWRNYQQQLAGILMRNQAELMQTGQTHLPAILRSWAELTGTWLQQASQQTAQAGERQRQVYERMTPSQDGSQLRH